tara:strand:+ start:483 stop:863 length:381 start_codon:yes stop_codon:yes gene_type:complete
MILNFIHFLLKLVSASLLVFGLHFVFNHFGPFPLERTLFITLHSFHFFASLFTYLIVLISFQKHFDRAGFVFIAASILKMLTSCIFLLPHVLPKQDHSQNFALQFCVIFTYYLIFESVLTIRKLNA